MNFMGNPRGKNLKPDPSQKIIYASRRGFLTAAEAMRGLKGPMEPVFENILQTHPQFVNYAKDDFRLASGSSLIDAGTHLTRVAAGDEGQGDVLRVNDARFFQDGKGIPGVQADWIAIGSTRNVAPIASVDYQANSVRLARPTARKRGDKVWLYRRSDGTVVLEGKAPDIGAHEYNSQNGDSGRASSSAAASKRAAR